MEASSSRLYSTYRIIMETASTKTTLSLIVTVVLLIIALAVAIVSVSMTVGEVHHFQQQHTLATHKDVRAIRPWMTLTYISRFYHVPEPYLVDALHLTNTKNADRLPIQVLAQHNSRTITQMTDSLQVAIITYHREHPEHVPTATVTPHRTGGIQHTQPARGKPSHNGTQTTSSKQPVKSRIHLSTTHLLQHSLVRSV